MTSNKLENVDFNTDMSPSRNPTQKQRARGKRQVTFFSPFIVRKLLQDETEKSALHNKENTVFNKVTNDIHNASFHLCLCLSWPLSNTTFSLLVLVGSQESGPSNHLISLLHSFLLVLPNIKVSWEQVLVFFSSLYTDYPGELSKSHGFRYHLHFNVSNSP